MLLTLEELHRAQPEDGWFCLKTQTRRELIAAGELRTFPDVEVFCPQLRFRRATVRGAVWFQEAMFPGYLFARFSYPQNGRRVASAHGIRGLVHFGDRIALLSGAEIEPLREQCGTAGLVEINPLLTPGAEVTVTEGPLHGLEAVVTRVLPGRERVCILLSMLGREIESELPVTRLIAKGRPGI
jgi:transcription antitermination factor NusG